VYTRQQVESVSSLFVPWNPSRARGTSEVNGTNLCNSVGEKINVNSSGRRRKRQYKNDLIMIHLFTFREWSTSETSVNIAAESE
jgi:hypothetical protein